MQTHTTSEQSTNGLQPSCTLKGSSTYLPSEQNNN